MRGSAEAEQKLGARAPQPVHARGPGVGAPDEEQLHEAEMPGFDGLKRLVRRNPETVDAVLVNGRVASREDRARPELGVERGFGRVLRAH